MGTKLNPGKFDCYDAAEPDEPLFTILGRDPTGPILVGFWVELRKAIGDGDLDKLHEAELCAEDMARYLMDPKRSKKNGHSRKDLLVKAVNALRTDFVSMLVRATPETIVETDPARAHYKEIDAIIKNNTGIVGRAEKAANALLDQGHTHQSARAQLLKDVHEDIVIVYLAGLDIVCDRRSRK